MDGSKLALLALLLAAVSYGTNVDYALFTNVQKLYSGNPSSSTYVTVWINSPVQWQPFSRQTGTEIKHRMYDPSSTYGDGICIFNGVKYRAINSQAWSGTKWFATQLVRSASDTPYTTIDLSTVVNRPLWELQFVFAVTSLDKSGGCPGPAPPAGITVSQANPSGGTQTLYYWDPDFYIAKGAGNMFFPSSNGYSGWQSDVSDMLTKYGHSVERVYLIGDNAAVSSSDESYVRSALSGKGSPVTRIGGAYSSGIRSLWPSISREALFALFNVSGTLQCDSFITVPYYLDSSNGYREMLKASSFARVGKKSIKPGDTGGRRCFLIVDPDYNPLTGKYDGLESVSSFVGGKKVYSVGVDCGRVQSSAGASSCYGGSSDYSGAYSQMYMDTPDHSANAIFCDSVSCKGSAEEMALISTLTDVRQIYTDSSPLGSSDFSKFAWDEGIVGYSTTKKFSIIDSNGYIGAYYSGAGTALRSTYSNTELTGDTYLPYFDQAFNINTDESLAAPDRTKLPSLFHFFYRRVDAYDSYNDRYMIITGADNMGLMAIAGGLTGVATFEGSEARRGQTLTGGGGGAGGGGGGGGGGGCAPSCPPGSLPVSCSASSSPSSAFQTDTVTNTVRITEFSTGNAVGGCTVTGTVTAGIKNWPITLPETGTTGTYQSVFSNTNDISTYGVSISANCPQDSDTCSSSFSVRERPKPELRVRIIPSGPAPACGNTVGAVIACEERPYGGSWQPANASTVTGWSTTGFASDDCTAGSPSCTGQIETFSDAPNVTVGATCYVTPGTHLVDSASATQVISCTGWTCRTRLRIMPRGTTSCGQTMTSDLSCEYWLGGGVWEPLPPASVTGWALNGFTSSNCPPGGGASECTATLNTSAAQLSYYANATCRVAGGCAGDVSTANYLSCSESSTGDRIWIVNASCTPGCVQAKMIERPHMFEYLLGHLNCPEMLPGSTLACRVSVLNENPAAVSAVLNMSLPSGYDSKPVTLAPSAVSSFDLSIPGPSAAGGVYEGRIQLRKQGRLEDAHVVPVLASVGNLTVTRMQQFAMPEYDGWLLPAALAILAVSMLALRGRK